MAARSLLRPRRLFHSATDVDDGIADDAEANPALHSGKSLVAATAEAVSPFGDADAPFAAGAPLLPLRNQRFFCSRLRSGLLVERLGMQTRLMPFAFAA